MKRKCLVVGIGIISIALLILTSLTNVVGYQSVQLSNQTVIDNEVNQKEVLFQTILDIANNKDIQKIILKSQMTNGKFFDSNMKFSAFNIPVLTKNQLKHMYLIGLMLSKTISKSKMHSLLEHHQMIPQGLQKEITAVIEKDAILNAEITQLSKSKCDCENENIIRWSFPVLCTLLLPLLLISAVFYITWHQFPNFFKIIISIGEALNCVWVPD